ncbi:MAG: hemolysin family protein [Alphaproteobacteria bacterium]
MASHDESERPTAPRKGLMGRIRRWMGAQDPEPVTEAEALAESIGGRLVDQAQAFQTLRVEDVMTPRADIVAVELDIPFHGLVQRFIEAEHSRMPIFRDTLDDPVGVVHVKDVFKLMAGPAKGKTKKPEPEDQVLQKLRRDALYVPASMRAADLMLRMQSTRTHMALVIDEFGGTDGLVTLEDLVEAVVGEIDDEHDEAQVAGVVARPGDIFEADARAPLEELEAAVGRDLAPADLDEDIDTIGGLVTALAGRVPQRGEVIPHPDGYEIQILDADPRRVKRVRWRRTPEVAAKP